MLILGVFYNMLPQQGTYPSLIFKQEQTSAAL